MPSNKNFFFFATFDMIYFDTQIKIRLPSLMESVLFGLRTTGKGGGAVRFLGGSR